METTFLITCALLCLVGSVPSAPRRYGVQQYDKDLFHPTDFQRTARSSRYTTDEEGSGYWIDGAQKILINHLKEVHNTNRARNVIMFLGDGMSVPTLAAARVYQGQLMGETGEESHLFFEDFPYTGFSKTYCVDSQVADSACTATAYLCGVKGNKGTIGVTASVDRGSCEGMRNQSNQVSSLLKWAQDSSKSTGIITTARVTHASPAGAYASVAERNWESDADVASSGQDTSKCDDIAEQLVFGSTGKNFQVILGGGREGFIPADKVDEEGEQGKRLDGRDLVQEWQKQKESSGFRGQYIWNRKQLLSLNYTNVDYLLGLFEGSHMKYHLEADEENEPTLAEMTEAAIKLLSKEKNGFALFVEGGRIDHAHHSTTAKRALDETVEMAKAVKKAMELTSNEDTLIVVTADHAHTMSYSGYPTRGNDILGLAGLSDVDKLPYSTLSYANGPGFQPPERSCNRHDLTEDNMKTDTYEYPALVPLTSETHGGDDVAVFATGPWAHLLTGMYEQNYIPHVMAYASCIGSGLTACSNDKR
ncbi:membrane-bound alkaline phosphatase isoform X2 [Anabrus simplex]|uniref:membrane-bound alkaline phosphatase isoform X2 n=1 Tax=Anabrus simplex TaxID=316456 RepID=UPI0035A35171